MMERKALSKISKIWIGIIAIVAVILFSLVYALGMNNTEIEGYSDPFASGAPVGDPNFNRPTDTFAPVPPFLAPEAQGLVGEENPQLAKNPDGFVEIRLPFIENQSIQEGDGFIIAADGLEPDSTFTSRIYIDGESSNSDTAFDSHSIKTDALGIMESPFALPTNLSVGKYVLELTNGSKSFQIHFTVIKTGEQHAGV